MHGKQTGSEQQFMHSQHRPTVLITGCSSGIGEALCHAFHQQGAQVIATARRLDSISALAEKGMQTAALDVNSPEQIQTLTEALIKQHGQIDILVNNAGFALIGPSIELNAEDLRAQFETNLIAPLLLAQALAPAMKAAGQGKIVNIGSISGIATTPFSGAYCASKAALHSFSDALRMELAPFGIQVITVQPGAIASQFGATAARQAAEVLKPNSWYRALESQILKRAEISQQGATPADSFARQVSKLLLLPQPPAIIRLGKKSRYLPTIKRWLPNRVLDKVMKKKFGLADRL